MLAENPAHPSLRSKPVQGIYEASPDMHDRMTYERLPGDVLCMHVLGPDDDALKSPCAT